MSQEGLERIGVGSAIGVQWGEALHNALMPMTPAMSLSSLSDGTITCSGGGLQVHLALSLFR